MTTVRYTGFLGEDSGYGRAGRLHCKALANAGVCIEARSVRLRRGGFEPAPRVSTADVEIIHTPPSHFSALRRGPQPHVGACAWETDILPEGWREPIRSMAELWVPSQFCAEIFARASRRPVVVVPHPIEVPTAPPLRGFPSIPDDLFLFVSILEWSDRKNPVGLIRAFCNAFRGRRDCALLLKLSFHLEGASRVAALRVVKRLTVGLGPWRAPLVFVVAEPLGTQAMARLLERADAYVSLHRSEGFGLCLAEAMAAGKPVVATRHSGNLEFMDDRSAFLVDARIVSVKQELTRTWFTDGMHWAEPDLDAAVGALRDCASRTALRERIAAEGRARVLRDLAPERIGALMRERVEWLGGRAATPAPEARRPR